MKKQDLTPCQRSPKDKLKFKNISRHKVKDRKDTTCKKQTQENVMGTASTENTTEVP